MTEHHKISGFCLSHFKRHKNDDDKVVKTERKGLILSLLSTSVNKHKTYIFPGTRHKHKARLTRRLLGRSENTQKHSHKIEEQPRAESEALSNKNNHG